MTKDQFLDIQEKNNAKLEEIRKEMKSDIRWTIETALTISTLVLAILIAGVSGAAYLLAK